MSLILKKNNEQTTEIGFTHQSSRQDRSLTKDLCSVFRELWTLDLLSAKKSP